MKRVLHIFSGYGGGTSSLVRNLASAMPGRNIIFDVICFSDVPEHFRQEIARTGGDVYRMVNPKTAGFFSFRRSFQAPFQKHPYDAVHCHMPGYRATAFWLLSRRFGRPRFLIHAHGKIQYGAASALTSFKIALDGFVNRHFSSAPIGCGARAIWDIYGPSVPESQMMMIPNGVDVDAFYKAPADHAALRSALREQLGLSAQTLVVAQIGRLTWIKNHKKMFDIAAYARDHQEDAVFLVAGTGDEEDSLQREVAGRGLSQTVRFLGRVEPLSDFLPAVDVLLLPSYSEGLPTVLVEGQAAGLPALASDTVTHEMDFGLRLVEYEPLAHAAGDWWAHIRTMAGRRRPSEDAIRVTFEALRFTRESAGGLYADFLEGRVHTFALRPGVERPEWGWKNGAVE